MRILFITHFLPPKFNAGTEKYTLSLARSFLLKGYEVKVLCAEDWYTGDKYWNGVTEDVCEGVPVTRIHLNWTKAGDPNRMLYNSPMVEKWLTETLKTMQPDLVHVTSAHSLGVGILRSVRQANIPLILTLMDFWFICPSHQLVRSNGDLCDGITTPLECQACLLGDSNLLKRLYTNEYSKLSRLHFLRVLSYLPIITKLPGLRGMLLNMDERKRLVSEALNWPDVILTHSKFVQSIFHKHSPGSVEVLINGHDFKWKQDYKGKTSSSSFRFGYIGQIQFTKGVHVLIEAFVRANLEDCAKLEIWGDTSRDDNYVQHLQTQIKNNPAICMNGRFEHDQLAEVLAGIDVLIVPSLWYENAPLVIQEAFASQTPVIATNLGGMAEAVTHEVNGLMFRRGDADDLAAQLRRFIEEPGLRERLQKGIPEVKTIAEEVAELELVYRDLVNSYRENK